MAVLTLITPTFNRATTLIRCWESLRRQTSKQFQWLVIDDGSTDNTATIMGQLKQQTTDFIIDYYHKPNGGKHTALNFSHPYIEGDFVLILDSDDFLSDDAVEIVLQEWSKVLRHQEIGGITFMCGTIGGDSLAKMPCDSVLSNHIEFRINQKIQGDCCETLRSPVFKNFLFPEISGENFLGEGMLWTTIALTYQTLYLARIIYIVPEYRSDGLTKSGRKMRLRNLRGALLNNELHMNHKIIFRVRIKNALLKTCYSFFLKKNVIQMLKETQHKALVTAVSPFGYLLYQYWHRKYSGE
ncbi:glycosyltransferase family A protein [Lapidilactobacillus gannanensis]|uniref:Glycosyltransferase family A protein n=1 Tax=Lapidilactobacillus gannanensis TaxID=2486002 RepID=A0ABW4BMQ7_9LACO|nr:glycosyltransferase family 2 protein [Lapidilactobacillus gannanensis]